MNALFGAIVVIAALLPACAVHEWREYDIKAASSKDVTRVQQIIHSIAAEAGMPRHFGGSYSPNQPIANYMRDEVQLLAFLDRGEIRIWLIRDGWPPSPGFATAQRAVEPALASAFGTRFVVEPVQPVHIVYTDR
jgi:hypothetical protein